MTNPVKPKTKDTTFSSFAIGVAVGIGAVLLFGTDEGKRLSQKLFESLPEKIKNLTDNTEYPTDPLLDSPQTETPHSYQYQNEPPPPPAPHVTPRLPA